MDLSLQVLIDHERVPTAEVERWLSLVASAGVTGVQLREKAGPSRENYAYGERVARVARELGLWFSVNDRLDLALALEADLVHLGPDDLPPEAARRIAPTLGLGLSARNLELAEAVRRSSCPIVAIGGIQQSNAASVWAAGVAGLAVISAVTEARDPAQVTRSLIHSRQPA